MDLSFNQITKRQNAKLIPRSQQKAVITAVSATVRQVDLYFVNNPQTILRGVSCSAQIDMTTVSIGQKCVVQVFDENNVKDMVVSYTYGGTSPSSTPAPGGSLEVVTVDTTVDVTGVNKIIVPNGSLTDNGGGSITIVFGGGGSLEVTDGTTEVTGVIKMDFPSGSVTDLGSGEVSISISAGAAGLDTQIQFNHSGSLGANSNFTFLKTAIGFTFHYYINLGTLQLQSDAGASVAADTLISTSTKGLSIRSGKTIILNPNTYNQLGPTSGGVFVNTGLNGIVGFPAFGSGVGVFGMMDAVTLPGVANGGTDPVGGGILYSSGGSLYWVGSSGTVTLIAPA